MFCTAGGSTTVATAFLCAYEGRRGLTTVAHVSLGENPPTSEWHRWPEQIEAPLPDGSRVAVPLMEGSQPIFHYIEYDGGRIADVLWLPWDRLGDAGTTLRIHYKVHQLDPNFIPDANATVACFGYPGSDPWPAWPPKESIGVVKAQDASKFWFTGDVQAGQSGSPALASNGRLLGMAAGTEATAGGTTVVWSNASLLAVVGNA